MRAKVKAAKQDLKIEADRVTVSKIDTLCNLLEAITIDEDNTVFNSEPKFKQVFTDQEQGTIKNKIMQLVGSL